MNACKLLIAGLLAVLAVPAAAYPADGPIRDPEQPRSSRVAQLGFTLPDGWKISRGQLEGTPSRGGYVHEVSLGDEAVCETSIRAGGVYRSKARTPRVVRGKLRDGASSLFAVAASGRLPGGRWYSGPVGEAAKGSAGLAKLSGAVVLTSPASLQAPGQPVVLAEFSLIPRVQSPRAATPEQRRRCRAVARPKMAGLLERVLRSVRVEAYSAEPDAS